VDCASIMASISNTNAVSGDRTVEDIIVITVTINKKGEI
jgi:hypothetical protein